ncbi:MAG: hypothetical protein OEL76_01975 [Siculibacillus sp.]|nr:hypothetical protein [Siculibacillus sp.]
MADYHAILKRAITALPSPIGEARRAVYEKARTALVNQLKSFDPPLSASEITQQRLQLEDAIRKVESEAAKGLLRQAHAAATGTTLPPTPAVAEPTPEPVPTPVPTTVEPTIRPPTAPPPGSPVAVAAPGAMVIPPRIEPEAPAAPPAVGATGVLKRAVDEAGALGGATAELGRQARGALADAVAETPAAAAFGRETTIPPTRRTEKEKRRRRRQEVVAGEVPPSRLPLMVGVGVAILVVGIGIVALWSQREAISAFFGGAKAPIVDMAQRQSGEKLVPKASDRLSSDDAAGRGNPVKPVPTQTINPNAAAPQLQSAGAATPPVAQTEAAKPAAPKAQAVPLVAQKAILYEEGKAGGGQAQISPGKVVWTVVPDPTDPKAGAVKLEARIEIPERGFAMNMQMRPNGDTSFPASHLIELKFTVPADFDGKSVNNVPGLIMKTTEQARGDPLVGAAAKVADNFFWVALGASEQERARNLKMIRERGWIDVPLLYESGRRAILTLEKAGAGDQAVTDALTAWGQGG